MSGRAYRGHAFIGNGRPLQRNAGWLLAAATVGLTGAAAGVAARRRWRAAEDPCAGLSLDVEGAETFKVERPDGAGHMLPYEEPDRLAELILAAGPGEGGAS